MTQAQPIEQPQTKGSRSIQVLSVLVLVACIISIAACASTIRLTERLSTLSNKLDSGNLEAVVKAANTNPSNRHITLTSSDKKKYLECVLAKDGVVYVSKTNIDKSSGGRSYQLWAKTPTATTNVAVLGGDLLPSVLRIPAGTTQLLLTNEADGGASQPGPAIAEGLTY